MRRKRIPIGLLAAGIALAIALGVFGDLMRPALEPDRVVEARFGDVKWNHELHARMKGIANCQVCHHTERAGTTDPQPCQECHKPNSGGDAVLLASLHDAGAGDGVQGGVTDAVPSAVASSADSGEVIAPPPMTAYHGKCVGCHEAMAAGPVGCRDCHAQEFSGSHGVVRWDHHAHSRRYDLEPPEGSEDVCLRCHHQDEKAGNEGEYRACHECHDPAPTMELTLATGLRSHEKAKHGECVRCHTVSNPEDDLRTCKDCHTGWNVVPEGLAPTAFDDPATPRPPLEQAVHARCAECHREDWSDFTATMPVGCDECHEPDPSILADLGVGLVMWDHDRHAKEGQGGNCTRCHHADGIEQPHMACSRCHGTGLYENPTVADALRQRCLGCHEEKDTGLLTWDHVATDREQIDFCRYEGDDGEFWWDHRTHAVAWSFSCRNCHHGTLRENGEYVTAAAAETAWTGEATHVQACTKCHGADGPVAGSAAAGSKAPKLGDAYQKICLECHRQLGGGPQEWNEYFEIETVGSAGEDAETGDAQSADL